MGPFTGKLYKHPAISSLIGVFVSVDVEILRDRHDLELDKGSVMQIEMQPNGHVVLGTFRNGNGTCYATVADGQGNTVDVKEGVDFQILPSKGTQSNTENDSDEV